MYMYMCINSNISDSIHRARMSHYIPSTALSFYRTGSFVIIADVVGRPAARRMQISAH
jgi:hypothetical protein